MSGRFTHVVLHLADIYYQGEDAYITIEHYASGALADAVTATVTVRDPVNAAVVSAAAMTKTATGVYGYEWAIGASANPGPHRVQVTTTYTSGAVTYTNMEPFKTTEVRLKA
uniref:Macroglobulin domain-containing protein n=1 Tax=viral metagenome TaxID=1070528 RepID=A0A6M3KYD1_9ZZZZ